MRKISRIEPAAPPIAKKKKVAAYCRVSVETEQMHHSLSAQVSHYSSLIQNNPEWEYAGVFADFGISGTRTKHREKFQEMIACCEAGKIDIILTKSISRFARNTVDLLETVRSLKEIGVEVRFERERINSLSSDGELMLTILASFAQEEVRSLSDNIKWVFRRKFQQGRPHQRFRIYGYRWDGWQLVIEPDEAENVRRVFSDFIGGKTLSEITAEFKAEKIPTAKGGTWTSTSMRKIIINRTYVGSLLLQKTFIPDPINKRQIKNDGDLPQYLIEGAHEQIIPQEVFDLAQAELARRQAALTPPSKTCFSGKIKCAICGRSYMRTSKRRQTVRWQCLSQKGRGLKNCGAKTIREETLKQLCCEALRIDSFDEEEFSRRVEKIIVVGNRLEFYFYGGGKAEREWKIITPSEWHTPRIKKLWSEYALLGRSKGTGLSFIEYQKRRDEEDAKAGNGDTGDDK